MRGTTHSVHSKLVPLRWEAQHIQFTANCYLYDERHNTFNS